MERERLDTHQKALRINMDRSRYGTIAEIGAGQETARWFFQVGGAAGTIAKAMSAYDMTFSDSIYGPSPRYVSRERLHAMLALEYKLVVERLESARGDESTFFAFANTVASRSFSRDQDGHGWLGIRFQAIPGEPPSQIDIHVNLRSGEVNKDQEMLGILGVNLMYGAFNYHQDPEFLLECLLDNLGHDQVEIDMIEFSGPACAGIDNRLMTLRLVQHGLTPAAMFTAAGEVVNAADALYRKAVLIERSRFRPPTNLTINLLDCAHAEFLREPDVEEENVLVLSEMTLHSLVEGAEIDVEDFLHRVDILCAMGKNVLISNCVEFYRLAAHLFRYTQKPVGVAIGVPTLREIFDEGYYADLEGGILESFGRLFKHALRFYVCPALQPDSDELVTAANIQMPARLRHLYAYLFENGFVKSLDTVHPEFLTIFSHDVLDRIRCGDPAWESMVPEQVATIIREKKLFGCVAVRPCPAARDAG